ncbi:unnamed protein product [Anisakis simplex]|uniref:Uncharacterized protein n=1 Tax=Anisakis simplex TaxID=6269 RepID=A0A0M3K1R7_ANISI|nr:unnamed protein product [Anisakis simplex]
MSTYSNVTMTSTRITPSSSRTNLRAVGVGASQHSSAALSKLNEMRDRLRKSQENLAMPIGDESGLNATSLHMSRSRSIGNLRFSTAPQLSASQQQLTSAANAPTPNDPTATMPGADFETKPESLMRNRQIARSVGNLNNSPGAQQAVGDSADESVSYTTRRAPTRLAQTIEKLKKARSVSSVEGMPRPGTLQSARRIFEQQRHGSTGVMRRAPNYLAQKLACGDVVGPDMGAEECPHPSLSPNDPSTSLPDFDSKSSASKREIACLLFFSNVFVFVLIN